MKNYLAGVAAILLFAGTSALKAQDAPPQDDQQQPAYQDVSQPEDAQQVADSEPGVARVSFIHGDVSTQRGDNGQWVAVTLNTPIMTDDRVSTGDRSRAELQLNYANVLRMSERATARVANLSRTQVQLQVGQGLVTYNVLRGNESSSEIDTPNAAIRPASDEGEYRILVNSDQETQVIVRRGSADISTPQGTTRVDRGQMITIAGTADSAEYRTVSAPDPDDWDRWNAERNHTITSAQSWGKTNRYYTGSEDLDSYGHWGTVPDYGPVWIPSVGPDWAPYRAGRWVWEPYYGWTWVSYEPWGWAPYHYGRWFVWDNEWVLWPGPVVAYPAFYPVWAPAYVSFFGFGGGFGFGVGFGFGWGFGHVGWLPCGPGDWFHPWFGRFGGRVNVVNITNINNTTIINRGWAPLRGGANSISNVRLAVNNDHVRAGFSSMAGNQFGRGSVPLHQSTVSAATFRSASLSMGKMPVTPSKGSFSATDRAASRSTIQHAPPSSQRFFTSTRANTQPSASANTRGSTGFNSAPRGSRSTSQPAFNAGRGNPSIPQPHANAPAMNSGRGNEPSNSHATTQPGWHPFGSGAANRNTARGANPPQSSAANRPNGSSTPGWHTFNPPSRPATNSRPSQPPAERNSTPRSFEPPAGRTIPPAPPERGSQGGWQHFSPPSHTAPPSNSSRGGASATNRPALNMNKPIVTPRSRPSDGGFRSAPNNGGFRNAPSNGGFRPAPAPNNGGFRPAPAPNNGGFRGQPSAPRGNSGSFHSAPAPSRPAPSAPSRGGSGSGGSRPSGGSHNSSSSHSGNGRR